MAWMYGGVHLDKLLIPGAAVVLASCGALSAGTDNCDYQNNSDEAFTLLCIKKAEQPIGDGAGGSDNGSGIPILGNGGSGIPILGNGGSSSGVPILGNGGSAVGSAGGSTLPSGGAAVGPIANAGVGPDANAGSGTTAPSGGSDGLGGGASNPLPSGGSGTVAPPGVSLGKIQVSAGTQARDHTVVSFAFPAGKGKNLVLKDIQGNQIPLQVGPLDDNATFVLPSLAAGAQAEFTVEEAPQALPNGITAAQEGKHLFVKYGSANVFRWLLEKEVLNNAAARDQRAGYIFPLYTPGGLNVADDYAPDHPHMHGIWSAWTSTTFRGHAVDFWNGYANSGRVDLVNVPTAWSGVLHGGLVANLKHTDITTNPPVDALKEQWVVTVYKTHDAAPPYYIFDIDSTQETATNDPLVLEQYHYGGFGFRGSLQWRSEGSVQFLTSEGHNRGQADGKTAKWCAQFGAIDGKVVGYAGLGYKGNDRFPEGLRVHPTNPYWSFTASTPASGGRFSISPGKPYKSRYRVVSFDGPADKNLLNRLWEDFSTPPTVTLLPP